MKCKHCVGLVAAALVMFLTVGAWGQTSETATVTAGMLVHNREYATGLNLIVDVTRSVGPGFRALVGPLPDAVEGESTVFEVHEVMTGSQEKVRLDLPNANENAAGFIYMAGVQPYGGTDGGSATGEGTIMVIQKITDGNTVHRFFRLESAKKVHVVDYSNPPNERFIKFDWRYVERVGNGSFSDPITIPVQGADDPDEVRLFIAAVLQLATTAGLPTPVEQLP